MKFRERLKQKCSFLHFHENFRFREKIFTKMAEKVEVFDKFRIFAKMENWIFVSDLLHNTGQKLYGSNGTCPSSIYITLWLGPLIPSQSYRDRFTR
jgi:hypothetical protein